MSDLQDANESLGCYLKRNREVRNISVEQVAYATRISLKMLRALEEDDHTALPASTFVRGYLQAYAKYVRIDTQDLLLRYQHHLATAPDTKKNSIRSHYLYVRERYQEKRRLVLIIVLFATMLSVAGTYFMLKAKREHNKRLAQTAEQIQRQSEAQQIQPNIVGSGTINIKDQESASALKSEKKEETKAEKIDEKIKEKEEAVLKAEAEKKSNKENKAEAKKPEEKPVEKPAPVVAAKPVEAKPIEAPKPVKPAEPVKTEAKSETKPETKPEEAKEAKNNQRKVHNLLLKTKDVDVWFRFQADDAPAKNVILKAGNAIMLRADKVIKIFSGNLGALRATQDGKEVSLLTTDKAKSFVWPLSEAANYPPPLFPDIQTGPKKTETSKNDTGEKKEAETQ